MNQIEDNGKPEVMFSALPVIWGEMWPIGNNSDFSIANPLTFKTVATNPPAIDCKNVLLERLYD